MGGYFTHKLAMDQDLMVQHGPSESFAIVDLESYPTFVGKRADRLDLMAHLQNQSRGLTAFAWDAPGRALKIRFRLTADHAAMERVTRFNRPPSASGTVRTQGRICLAGQDPLIDCARHPAHSLLAGGHLAKECRPRVLEVPPGILYILVYCCFPHAEGNRPGEMPSTDGKADYTIFLHHYPPPARRLVPVRLPGLSSLLRDQEAAAPGVKGIISTHSRWLV
jgi:hypothetical protein